MQRRAAAYVPAVELRECRANPKWEMNRGILDFIVCRHCGFKIRGNVTRHLHTHGYKRVAYYLAKFPDAPTVIPRLQKKGVVRYAAMKQAFEKHKRIKLAAARGGRSREPKKRNRIGQEVEDALPLADSLLAAIARLSSAERKSLMKFNAALAQLGFSDADIADAFVIRERLPLARHLVANSERLDFETVKRHHQTYRNKFSPSSLPNKH